MKRNIPVSLEQLRALNSILRIEILMSLTAHGSGTAKDIAVRLGVDEHKLYYHLKKLAAVDLVLIEGSRPTATKPEAIFSVAGTIWIGGFDLNVPGMVEELDRHFGLFLKMAALEYSAALTSPDHSIALEGSVFRGMGVMNEAHRYEFKKKVDELNKWMISLDDAGGLRCGCTFSFQPLVDRKSRKVAKGEA